MFVLQLEQVAPSLPHRLSVICVKIRWFTVKQRHRTLTLDTVATFAPRRFFFVFCFCINLDEL